MQKEWEDEKSPISDKLLLGFGWVFIVAQLLWAMANLYILLTSNTTNELSNLLNVVCGFIIYVLFQKSNDKVWLSKLYVLLTLFALMYFSVVYVFIGSLKQPTTIDDLLAFVIMLVGTGLIAYLSHKFFNRWNISVQWKIHNELPPFCISHSIKGRQHTIKISPVDKADDDTDDEYLPF